jgi:NAD(P)-dependent dehydrogenase (short-subunit alcohol dehydrogenase family)
MSSFLGQLSMAGLGVYSATKFALEGLSEALAAELASFGVRVLIVEPGGFRTGFNGDAFRMATPVDAYRPALDPLRTFVAGFGSRAPGDPARAADALLRLLDEPALPLRVQLGTDSADAIRQHSTSMLRDLAQWHEVAASTDYAHADAAR